MQYSVAIRDAQNDAARGTTGPSPILEIRSGPEPENCQAPDAGVLIASGTLPIDWLQASRDGLMQKSGEWLLIGQPGAGRGMAGGHFRIKARGVCHWQGKFGKGMEMEPETNRVAAGQYMLIKTFSVRRANG